MDHGDDDGDGAGDGDDTTRETLTAGGQNWVIPGGLQTAGDHIAGGNSLPPAVCKPPGVTQFTTGALHKQPGVFCYRQLFTFRRG